MGFMKTVTSTAYARAGLIGNPSDGYHGKTISVILRNFRAEATCRESPTLKIVPRPYDGLEFNHIDDLLRNIRLHGYYGGVRLIKACIKKFHDYCRSRGIDVERGNFAIEYRTDIPVRLGLAGSSAIITAAFRALMGFFEVDIPKPVLPNIILSVETEELGINAGLQDRVIQVYEGVVFMDFNRELFEARGHGNYEAIDADLLPPLFIAFHEDLAEGTEVGHRILADRYRMGDRQVIAAMDRMAQLAQEMLK